MSQAADGAAFPRINSLRINNRTINNTGRSVMAITDWPVQERPREKLLERGAEALSDAELLAIFLRTGVPG
jgi:hypothetical protein